MLRYFDMPHSRLRTFLDYRDAAGRVALARIPATADWGVDDNIAYLCEMSTPLLLWAVGTLQSITLVASDVMLNPGCDVQLNLLRDLDRDALALLHARSCPAPSKHIYSPCACLISHLLNI